MEATEVKVAEGEERQSADDTKTVDSNYTNARYVSVEVLP